MLPDAPAFGLHLRRFENLLEEVQRHIAAALAVERVNRIKRRIAFPVGLGPPPVVAGTGLDYACYALIYYDIF